MGSVGTFTAEIIFRISATVSRKKIWRIWVKSQRETELLWESKIIKKYPSNNRQERKILMSVSIKVAVRCRPFTCEDSLGVSMTQTGPTEGEVVLLNSKCTFFFVFVDCCPSYSPFHAHRAVALFLSKYFHCTDSTNRFGFTWSWWSAHNGKKYAKSNPDELAAMKFMGQKAVYESCGQQIKNDLLEGNAVVMFAYGLSGSGKTFTVFGPDDPATDVAWFKHATPFDMWGIFPYLAYEVFEEKKDGWKISMKYFQNVVSICRDLQSPVCKEESYKTGMRKDKDGFMDVAWCTAVPLSSWDDLRSNFQTSNARKAISPTQFNHQSTRGHVRVVFLFFVVVVCVVVFLCFVL